LGSDEKGAKIAIRLGEKQEMMDMVIMRLGS
jgi:hypothetical protein